MKYFLLLTTIFIVVRASEKAPDLDWWKNARIYQIYPRSFKDSNNDGIGDIPGIIEKLPYLAETGITAVWLSPIFESPQVDQGYDVSNYTDIDPDYGTLADVDQMIQLAHLLGMKVIFDLVPNHSSDQHQWFLDSVAGIEEYRDFYVWRDAKLDENGDRIPPNNWISAFKNSAWTWSEERQQYYLHQFTVQQPDLNYRNPKVIEAMDNVMTFWMDFGVDGFRVDAPSHIFEDINFPDEPLSGLPGFNDTDYEYLLHIYTFDQPETFDLVYHWREFIDNYTTASGGDKKIFMTETGSLLYYGTPDGSTLGAHFSFNFRFTGEININSTAINISNTINNYLTELSDIYTPNWLLGNHDNHRVATRLGLDNVDGYNMLTTVLPGVQITYNGEEIGMENGEVSFEEGQDPAARDPEIFEQKSRDFERTPYHWDNSTNAGFNLGAKPWLPVSEKHLTTNLMFQNITEGNSHYKIYKNLMALRQNPVLINGATEAKVLGNNILLVKRSWNGSNVALLFNNGDSVELADVSADVSGVNEIVVASVNSHYLVGQTIDPINFEMTVHESIIITF